MGRGRENATQASMLYLDRGEGVENSKLIEHPQILSSGNYNLIKYANIIFK